MKSNVENYNNDVITKGLCSKHCSQLQRYSKMLLKLVRKQLKNVMKNFPLKIKHIFLGIYYNIFRRHLRLLNSRLLICNKCNKKLILEGFAFCDICGCSLKLKTTVELEQCPLGKW